MRANWQTRKLEAVADFCLGKMLDQKKNRGEPLPYLANVNVRWGEFDLADLREMRFEQHELDRYGLKYGDIVMCEGGEPGRCAIWKEQRSSMMIQKALHRIRPHDCLRPEFLYYFFLYKGRTGHLSSLFTGSTIKHLPREKLALVEVPVPPHYIQGRIASILSAYDNLIENNRRRIQLLEQAARLLYKEWFVHLRFPGHEHTKIIDDVPEGWEKKKIAEVCKTVGGGTPSTKVSEYWNGDITWVVPSDITNNNSLILLESERKITDRGLRESSAKMVPAETILMTSRASVGFFALMDHEVCTNQGFINIVPYDDQSRMYLLFNLLSRVNEIRSNAKGTTYPEISKGRFREMGIIFPNKTLMVSFGEIAYGVIRQVRCLMRANTNLAKARDLLLPKLMNGEVAV
jgi:type I restriction enzyme S subunit